MSRFSVTRPWTAGGLFVDRLLQAESLLELPDFGDVPPEQRREALRQFVNVQTPLTALVLFLHVVALEDFIRDLGARLADADLRGFFPKVQGLRLQPRAASPNRPFARLDSDPAPLADFEKVNQLYDTCLGVRPLPDEYLPRLYDLALIRHTVAHHAARARPIDVARFQYWEVQPGQTLNPPPQFIRQVCKFIHDAGAVYERAVRDTVLCIVVPQLAPFATDSPPSLITDLIELFNFFGKLPMDHETPALPGSPEPIAQTARRRDGLLRACLSSPRG